MRSDSSAMTENRQEGQGMGELHLDSTMSLRKIKRLPELKEYKDYILYGGGLLYGIMGFGSLETMRKAAWNPDIIIEGLNYLHKKGKDENILYFVYDEEEGKGDKKDVNVIHFRAENHDRKKPYIVLAAGGGFTAVCSLMEGYLSAKWFNELGYDVFVLTYRATGRPGALFRAMDDLAAAIGYIRKNGKHFDVEPDHYIVGGFSAGGTLTAQWGTERVGYGHYKQPKPHALLPIYAVTTNKYFLEGEGKRLMDPRQLRWFMNNQFGTSNPGKELLDRYEILENVTKEYPPCYICCCEDDGTVPSVDSEFLYEKLQEQGIPAKLHIFGHGGHGFGCGKGTDAEGWIREADGFIQSLQSASCQQQNDPNDR